MYEIQTPVMRKCCGREMSSRRGITVNYSGAMSPYSGSYQLSHATGEEHKILIPFLSKERENMLLAEALFEIETGMQDHAECKNLARRLMIPTKEFLQQVDKNESEGYRINISKVTAHFYIDESSVIARGRELGIFRYFVKEGKVMEINKKELAVGNTAYVVTKKYDSDQMKQVYHIDPVEIKKIGRKYITVTVQY